jgi:hypothetical protein
MGQTKHVRINVNLFGTLDEIHMHSGSIRIISNAHKIHFGALNKTLFQLLNSNLFSLSSSMLLSHCAVSRVIKGLKAWPATWGGRPNGLLNGGHTAATLSLLG